MTHYGTGNYLTNFEDYSISSEDEGGERGKSVKSSKGGSIEKSDQDQERVFSTDYDDVCQYKCPLCSRDIDADKLSSHLSSSHPGGKGWLSGVYSRETWHRCGLCQKALLFTRLKLRYHVITEHGVAIQDYEEQFIKRSGRRSSCGASSKTEAVLESDLHPSSASKKELSDDYTDLLKTVCKICSETIEMDRFR